MNETQISTHNIIKLLHTVNSDELKRLEKKSKYKEIYIADSYRSYIDYNADALAEQGYLAIVALEETLDTGYDVALRIKKKIRTGKILELISEIVAVVTGGTLWAALADAFKNDYYFKLFAAAIVTFSSLTAVLVNLGLGTSAFNNRNVTEDDRLLPKYISTAQKTLRKLVPEHKYFDTKKTDINSFKNLINEADSVAEKLNEIFYHYKN